MKLTDKCREDFKKWFDENYNDYYTYYHTKPIILNALIIEFFDSVGYKILPCHGISAWYCELKNYNNKEFGNYKCHVVANEGVNDFQTRQEATNQAILTANKLYNETN